VQNKSDLSILYYSEILDLIIVRWEVRKRLIKANVEMHSTEKHLKRTKRERRKREDWDGRDIILTWEKKMTLEKFLRHSLIIFNYIMHEIYKRIVVIALLWLWLLYYYIIYHIYWMLCSVFFSWPLQCDDAGVRREGERMKIFLSERFLIYVTRRYFMFEMF